MKIQAQSDLQESGTFCNVSQAKALKALMCSFLLKINIK